MPSGARPQLPSWSTAVSAQLGAELRAIFEDDKSEAAAENSESNAKITPKLRALLGSVSDPANKPILRLKKSSSAKLRALIGRDEFNSEQEYQHIKFKNSSSTLDVVKNKFKKALPAELILSKRNSRSSVGTSEEEIERRAELRRIRQKRIQDELSSESAYDEDAKSLSTIAAGVGASQGKKTRHMWPTGDFLPLPLSTTPAYPFPRMLSLQQ